MAKDYEALGGMACYASRPREECPYHKPEPRDAWLRGWDDANRTRGLRAEQSVRAQIREVEARVARTLAAVESDRELIASLTADADRMALEHERPHGIRGLADRFASWLPVIGSGPLCTPLTEDELDDLLRWVHREMAREVGRRAGVSRDAASLARHLGLSVGWKAQEQAIALVQREQKSRGRTVWDGLSDNDRETLTDHIGGLLGGAFVNGDGKATAVAWALCDAAGRP